VAPTEEQKQRAVRNKKSLVEIASHLDIYSKFKLAANVLDRKIKDCLREAMVDWIKKYYDPQ
jgi:hypothetical protein